MSPLQQRLFDLIWDPTLGVTKEELEADLKKSSASELRHQISMFEDVQNTIRSIDRAEAHEKHLKRARRGRI